LGALEILHLNFGMGSKKHGFFRVRGHRPRPLLGQDFNMAKGSLKDCFPYEIVPQSVDHAGGSDRSVLGRGSVYRIINSAGGERTLVR